MTVNAGADPAATGSGKTAARLLGNVLAADNVSVGAASVNVLADARDFANARIQTTAIGAVTVGDSSATSHANPEVSVELGTSGSKVKTSSGISGKATSNYDSDATSKASAFGLVTITLLDATADANPKATVTVNDGSLSFTAGGLIDLFASQNKIDIVYSDGTFDAGDTLPAQRRAPGCIDRSDVLNGLSERQQHHVRAAPWDGDRGHRQLRRPRQYGRQRVRNGGFCR